MADSTNYYERPFSLVEGTMANLWARSQEMVASTQAIIDNLVATHFDTGSVVAPTAPIIEWTTPTVAQPAAISIAALGDVHAFSPPPVDADADLAGLVGAVTPYQPPAWSDGQDWASGLADPIIPAFAPSVSLSLPAAPAPIDTGGKPVRPTVDAVALPDAPGYTAPALPALTPIVVPSYSFDQLPTFQGVKPVFDAVAPSTTLQWQAGTYSSAVLSSVQSRLQAMLAGGTGLTPEIEAALFDRARSRASQASTKAVQEAFDVWAGRGFGMPPGMLTAIVSEQTQRNQLEENAFAREILVQAATWEIENLRQAVQQGIALEGALMQLFQGLAGLSLDAAKFQVQSEISLYNVLVAVFNAKQTAYQTDAAVFSQQVSAQLAVIRANLESQQLVGTLNEQKIRQYVAEWEGVGKAVEVWARQMEGAQTKAGVNRDLLAAWNEDLNGWIKDLEAQKVNKFDTYEALLRGEATKGQLIGVEAQAFATTLEGVKLGTNVKIENLRGRLQALGVATEKYTAEIGGQRSRLEADLSMAVKKADAIIAAHNAATQRFSARVGGESAWSAADAERLRSLSGVLSAEAQRYAAEAQYNTQVADQVVRSNEAKMRLQVSEFDVLIREYDAALQRMIEQARIVQSGIEAAGNMAAQLAAGSTAAMHVSASMEGGARISSGNNLNVNQNYDMTTV